MSLSQSLRGYVVEKGLASIPFALIPSLAAYYYGLERENMLETFFFSSSAPEVLPLFGPNSAFPNVTLVPRPGASADYFGPLYNLVSLVSFEVGFSTVCQVLVEIALSWGLFRPSRTGKLVSSAYFSLLAEAMNRLHFKFATENYVNSSDNGAEDLAAGRRQLMLATVLCVFLLYPLSNVICYHFSTNKDANKRQIRDYFALYFLFLLLVMGRFAINIICNESLRKFYLTDTSLLERLVLRGPVIALLVALSTSCCCRASHILIMRFKVNRHDASLLFVHFATLTALYGRLMQTSANTVWEAVLFDFAGTAMELFTIDGFLRGKTPVQEAKELLWGWNKSLSRGLSCLLGGGSKGTEEGKRNKVEPEGEKKEKVTPNQNSKQESVSEWKIADTKRVFCAQAIITHSMLEIMSLVVCSVLALSLRLNSGDKPGDKKLGTALVLTNLVIMLVGEVVVSDGLVQLMARMLKKRYVIDPGQEWNNIKTRGRSFLVIMGCIATAQTIHLMMGQVMGCTGCITAIEEEHWAHWAVTQCPPPPEDCEEMFRISPDHEHLCNIVNSTTT